MKHFVLIFSLVRTAFFSIYKNIIRYLAWHIKFEKKVKHLKNTSEELMPIVWHPKRWRNFCMSEDEKKKKQ